MLRIAMLSFWHVHAKDYARRAEQHPETQITAVWDEEPARGQAEAQARGARFYERLDNLLADGEIDAVIVDAPTNMHHAVMVAAANAGKHIFTEKTLAPTLAEAREIVAAVGAANVALQVSLPRLNDGYTLAIEDVLARGLLGDVTLARARLSHDGALPTAAHPQGWLPPHFFDKAQCGGGALIDLGCHPMYLARHFLGAMPESVSASYGWLTGRAVEDNAVATLRYPHGALGVVEAGFVNPFSPFTIELHGTKGSLLYGAPEPVLLVRSAQLDGGARWIPRDIPPARASDFDQWIAHIQQGTRATANITAALELSALMEAANTSAAQNAVAPVERL